VGKFAPRPQPLLGIGPSILASHVVAVVPWPCHTSNRAPHTKRKTPCSPPPFTVGPTSTRRTPFSGTRLCTSRRHIAHRCPVRSIT
uniref:Uncharacterized protein n=1 Tax=Anopheles albimanus TaxID=7167 RepID=A0A182FYZ7_ANOAL